MSDQYGSFDNPYGDAPYSGQQPPPYGQRPPYGGPPAPYGKSPARRPGTVTAAAVITIVLSALVALFGAALLVGTLVDHDGAVRKIAEDRRFKDYDPEDFVNLLTGMGVLFLVLSILAIIAAVFVLRRSTAARIVLVVLCAATIVLSAISIAAVVSLLTLIAAILVIVFLFVGGANAWFRGTMIVPHDQPW